MADEERPIVVYAAMGANFAIGIAKFVAAAITGSSAMISEGIHSIVDTGNEGLLLLGAHRGRQPRDLAHPFGHGRALYFWSLIVAMVLFGIGGGMSLYEGITHILAPTPLEDPTIALVVLAIAFLLEGGSWAVAAHEILPEVREEGVWKAIRTSKDPKVITVLGEDSAALVGLVVAAVGIVAAHLLNEPRLDGLASVVIGFVLAAVSVFLAWESRGLLIGERADEQSLARIERATRDDPAVERVESIRTMHLGPREILVTMQVAFRPGDSPLPQAVVRLREAIQAAEPDVTDITIEPVEARDGDGDQVSVA